MDWVSVNERLPQETGHVFAALLRPGTKRPFHIQWKGVTWDNETGWRYDEDVVEDTFFGWKVVYWRTPAVLSGEEDKRKIAKEFMEKVSADGWNFGKV